MLEYNVNIFRGTSDEFKDMTKKDQELFTGYMHGWEPDNTLQKTTFQYPEVIEGKPFFFLSWFVDSFKATKSGNKSVEGFYQSILNIDSRFRNTGEVHKTLSLIEPGVDVGLVFRAVTASSKLSTGFNAFMSHQASVTRVKGTLALAPADLVQLSAQCRHGGSAATHNCPNCTTVIKDRLDTTLNITDHGITRTRKQTDKIVEICLKWIETNKDTLHKGVVPNSVIKDIRREFGVGTLEPSWYEGWDFDEHRQGFREGEHLFYYGIFRQQLNWAHEWMNTEARRVFTARIDSFQWPDGMPSLSFDVNSDRKISNRWGTDVSMAMYKQLFVATLFALDGVIPTKKYLHIAKLWLWHLKILDRHNSVDDIPELQKQGLAIMKEGISSMKTVYDRPNGHGVIELIQRTLPALVYIRLVTSGNYERHHQLTKRTNASRFFIQNAMKSFNVMDTLRLLLHGAKWGPRRQYMLGKGLRCLKDPKDPSVPHKLLLNITSVLPQPIPRPNKSDLYHYHSDWEPYGYTSIISSHHEVSKAPDPTLASAIFRVVAERGEVIEKPGSNIVWRYPTRLRKWFKHGDHRIIKIGHTVLCEWDSIKVFAKIHNFIELRHTTCRFGNTIKKRRLSSQTVPQTPKKKAEWRIIFVQVQYYHDINETVRLHPIRNTTIVELNSDIDEEVFTAGHILRQVLAVHSCHSAESLYQSSIKCCPRTQNIDNLRCMIKARCPHHNKSICSAHTCSDQHAWSRRVEHCMAHAHFEIADEQHGLYFDAAKDLKYVDFEEYDKDIT